MVQTPAQVLYPDSDGKPMAENTVQYRWIVRLVTNLKRLLKDQTAFVAGDLLWYPVKVEAPPVPAQAPDAMVVLGRPAGDRGSYKQWEEDNVAPQVVFEVLSPSNSAREMFAKQAFYGQYGVLEMYFYDPDSYDFWGYVRDHQAQDLSVITPLNFPWTSPILKIRFELYDDGLAIFHPNGERFKEPEEYIEERNQAQQERNQAQQERNQAQQERNQAQQERNQAQQERNQAQQERDRAFARLRELGIDPNQL
ncbi:Uma2 family endonuclease [Romeria aff. gracilis LEGE 07310]|uniref:Uma2 family endonuclease n=1 Tax=Vasconcelosia minhoensis LEGE 07310 TaxID=915328 RepID=A0A8J7DD33_9CYAN|nr:Uma2 family endonuclease [Romeria gracilis]MBE9078308.1 Uma2 family endonuclease [Romeria aff. gracilis LEGE 07310]